MQPLIFRTHFNDVVFFQNNFDILQVVNYVLLASRALVNHNSITTYCEGCYTILAKCKLKLVLGLTFTKVMGIGGTRVGA